MSSECSVVECSGLCLVGEQCMCAVTHAGSTAVCFHKAPSRHCCLRTSSQRAAGAAAHVVHCVCIASRLRLLAWTARAA